MRLSRWRLVLRLPIQLLLAAILTASARANICPELVAQKDDPFDYAKSLIDSLGWAQSALSRLPSDESPKSAEQQTDSDFTNMMVDQTIAFKMAGEDYRCAAQSLEDYRQSRTKGIAASAKTAYATYITLMGYAQETAQERVRMLDVYTRLKRGTLGAESIPNKATLAQSISDRAIKIDDAWQSLLYALPPAEWALVEAPTKKGAPPSTLHIGSEQKKALLVAIERGFPKTKHGCEENPKYLEAAACLLHDFLSQEWKTLDSK